MAIGNSFSCSFRGVVSGEIGGSLYNSNSISKLLKVLYFMYHTLARSRALSDRRNAVEKITSKCRLIPGIVLRFASIKNMCV